MYNKAFMPAVGENGGVHRVSGYRMGYEVDGVTPSTGKGQHGGRLPIDVGGKDTAFYKPGDTITFDGIAFSGFITTNTTSMYYCIPLAKPVSPDVSSASITGTFTARGVNGYVEGNGRNSLSNYNVYLYYNSSCALGLRIVKDSALTDATNNTPISAFFEDVVIKFN